jgi:hypothetical protein
MDLQNLYDWIFRQNPDNTGISLKATGILIGLLLIGKHLWALLCAQQSMKLAVDFPRNRAWGIAILFVDMVWSLFLVTHMDMGEFYTYRQWITLLVPASFVLVVVYVPEFLAVRALGTLMLLLAEPVLAAAFLKEPTSRLLLAVLAYGWIFAGMFMIGMPYLMRDAITWLTKTSGRWKMAALAGAAYGALLLVAALVSY